MPRQPVTLETQDVQRVKQLQEFLSQKAPRSAQLVAPTGEAIELPEPVYQVLRQIVPLMAQGMGIGLVPLSRELTTQEAADLLGLSRSFLVKLLDDGAIPATHAGAQRRVCLGDVLAYKERRRVERRAALDDLTALAEEYGDYD